MLILVQGRTSLSSRCKVSGVACPACYFYSGYKSTVIRAHMLWTRRKSSLHSHTSPVASYKRSCYPLFLWLAVIRNHRGLRTEPNLHVLGRWARPSTPARYLPLTALCKGTCKHLLLPTVRENLSVHPCVVPPPCRPSPPIPDHRLRLQSISLLIVHVYISSTSLTAHIPLSIDRHRSLLFFLLSLPFFARGAALHKA